MNKINAVELYTDNGVTLYDVNGVVMTTTESIAKKFGKVVGDVNKKVKVFPDYTERLGLGKIAKSHKLGISDADVKSMNTYIDRDTMTLLVMGFTGVKAFEWKKQYIEAFNLMEVKYNQPTPKEFTSNDSVEEPTKVIETPKVLSFNTTKIEELGKVTSELGKVADGLMVIANAIIATKDDTATIEDKPNANQQIVESEVIKIDGVVTSSSEKVRTKHVHNTKSEYYNLPVTNLYDLPLDSPRRGTVKLSYYSENYGIWNREGKAIKIPLTQAIKAIGFTTNIKLSVTYSRTSTKGYFTVNRIIEVDGVNVEE
jgi:phage regulator Rha-like protein